MQQLAHVGSALKCGCAWLSHMHTSVSFMDGQRPVEHRIHSSQVQEVVSVKESIRAIVRWCSCRRKSYNVSLVKLLYLEKCGRAHSYREMW